MNESCVICGKMETLPNALYCDKCKERWMIKDDKEN